MTLKDVLLADLGRQWRAGGSDAIPNSWLEIVRSLPNNKYLPVVLVRLAHMLDGRGLGLPARLLSMVNQSVFGVEVALRSQIGPGLYLPHTGGIVLGARQIGANVTIYHGVTVGAAVLDVGYDPDLRPLICDDVVLASGCKVLGGVTVGAHSVVGANAVVVKDVEPNTVVGGIPATVIGVRTGEESW